MNTPDPDSVPNTPPSDFSLAPSPRRSWRTPLFVFLFFSLATASYFWRSQQLAQQTSDSTETPVAAEPGDVAAEQRIVEEDPLVQQLNSVSSQLDSATIRAELADTNTESIDAEMENIAAEVNGL